MMTGSVFDIQHFCIDDGPGIRTTVFLKGCPLRCIWCHNPEGLQKEPALFFDRQHCTGCERCAAVCPQHCHVFEESGHLFLRESCTGCGQCADVCRTQALRKVGKFMTVDDVMRDVLKDKPFYETSRGGITLSGGEPLFQADFTFALLHAARGEGLHTCLETSGFCSETVISQAADCTDLFLFDIKETDPVRHRRFTGVDSDSILRNAERLCKKGCSLILRCPVIPGCNDRERHFIRIAEMANRLGSVLEIQLEPYHPFGLDKYTCLGTAPAYRNTEFLGMEKAENYARVVREHTDIPVSIS